MLLIPHYAYTKSLQLQTIMAEMRLNFIRNIDLKLNTNESDFIHWFRNSVDQPNLLGHAFDKTDKHLFGQLKENEFWMEKKNKFFFKSQFSPLQLDLSSISGTYVIENNSVQLHLWIMLKPQIRNILLPGILIWTLIGFLQYFKYENTWAIQFAGIFWLIIAFILWRVNEDSKLIGRYFKEQFE